MLFKFSKPIFFIAILISFYSCEKEFEIIEDTPDIPEEEDLFISTVSGKVYDMDQNELPDVAVSVISNGATLHRTVSSSAGTFDINNESFNVNGTLVRFSKDGFISNYQFLNVNEDESHYTEIALLPTQSVLTFAQNENLVYNKEGVSFEIKSNDLNSTKSPFRLAVSYLNPEASFDFRLAQNTTGEDQLLEISKILSIDVLDKDGNKVNMISGKGFQITINESLSSGNDLWGLNIPNERWEEVSYDANGSGLEFTKTDFDYVAMAKMNPIAEISGVVKNESDIGLDNVRLHFSNKNDAKQLRTFTSNSGKFNLYAKGDSELTLSIEEGNHEIYQGVFDINGDTNLGDIILKNKESDIEITTPLPDVTVSVLPWICEAEYTLPAIEVDGDINDYEVSWISSSGSIQENGDGSFLLSGLTLEENVVNVTLQISQNQSVVNEKTFTINVIDAIGPVAICEERVTVSLIQNSAVLFAASIDAGSHDAGCEGDVTFQVERFENGANPDGFKFEDSVSFTSDDIGEEIFIILRVSDASGNYNDCMTIVQVVDKSGGSTQIDCPENVMLSCATGGLDPYENTALGVPTTNNPDHGINYTDDIFYFEDKVKIARRWTILDWTTNEIFECDQILEIFDTKPPTPYCIQNATTKLTNSGTVMIWAQDFDNGSFDGDCNGPLTFKMARVDQCKDGSCEESDFKEFMEFNQSDTVNEWIDIEIQVSDALGNKDVCYSRITVQ